MKSRFAFLFALWLCLAAFALGAPRQSRTHGAIDDLRRWQQTHSPEDLAAAKKSLTEGKQNKAVNLHAAIHEIELAEAAMNIGHRVAADRHVANAIEVIDNAGRN